MGALAVPLTGALATALTAAPAGADSSSVTISGIAYNPPTVQVHAGDTVVWTNHDPNGHSVTSDPGSAETFDSSPVGCPLVASACLARDRSFSHTFSTAGSFSYHCRVHASMHGTVVVLDSSTTTLATGTTLSTSTTAASTTTTAAGATTTAPGDTSTTGNPGSIGFDVPPSTAPGASVALKPAVGKHSSNAATVAVLAGCILLAGAGIGAVIYRIRADRAGFS